MKLKTEGADQGLTRACQTEGCGRVNFFMLGEYILKCLQICNYSVNAAVFSYDVGLKV